MTCVTRVAFVKFTQAMSTRPNIQLRPKRSHFNVNEELSEIQEDRIVLIYVAASGVNSIRERWVGTKKPRKKPIRVCFERPVVGRLSSVVW